MPGTVLSSHARGIPFRLSLFYATYFLAFGVQLPFWPVWLESRGMSDAEIGALVAVGVWARAIGNPLIASFADRRGGRRRTMIALAWACTALFALFAIPGGFWWLFLVSLGFGVLYAPLLALGESLTLLSMPARGAHYGRVRLWGSLTFIVAATISGQVLDEQPPEIVLWLVLGSLAALIVASHLVVDARTTPTRSEPGGPVRRLLAEPSFAVFLVAVSLVQGSHALYYAFGTLHWLGAGHGEGTIGWLWAEGVIAEILLFAAGARVAARWSPVALIGIGAAAGVVRWTVTAYTTDLGALLAVQPLHALTYGATHLGAIRLIATWVRPTASATAQSLYGGVANGLALGVMTWAAGLLYPVLAGWAYAIMAASTAMGAAGVVILHVLARRHREPPQFG